MEGTVEEGIDLLVRRRRAAEEQLAVLRQLTIGSVESKARLEDVAPPNEANRTGSDDLLLLSPPSDCSSKR